LGVDGLRFYPPQLVSEFVRGGWMVMLFMSRKDPVTLTQKEQLRLRVVGEVQAGRRTVAEAAEVLHLSERHVRRLRAGLEREGAAVFMHGNRGQPPPWRISDELRARVAELGGGRYAACNDTHLQELLLRDEGILLSRSSVRRIRRHAGQRPKRRHRPPRHRSRRDRRPQEGMLLQTDGSKHHWFGPELSQSTLLAAIDDATSTVTAALFRDQEDTQGYFLLLRQVLKHHGFPWELYHDRHSIFENHDKTPWTLQEELRGRREPTQFGRALEELGITSIASYSPEARGRIERLWGTFQDRLVAELELAGIKDINAANRFLPGFLKRFNARFAVQAEEPGLAYRPLDPSLDLDRILSFRYERVVARDNTVRLEERLIQVPPGPKRRSYFAAHVWVHEFLDGSLGVWYQDRWLARSSAHGDSPTLRARKRTPRRQPTPTPQRLPVAPDETKQPQQPQPHPWRTWNPGYLARDKRTESLTS
jgi:transposase